MTPSDEFKDEFNELMRALKFNPDDLVENRAGKLSESQLRRLQYGKRTFALIAIVAICLYGFIGAAITSVTQGLVDVIVWVVAVPICAYMLSVAFDSMSRHNRVLEEGVNTTRGSVRCEVIRDGERRPVFLIKLEKLDLIVPGKAYLCFRNGEAYSLYYLPQDKRVVSAEPGG